MKTIRTAGLKFAKLLEIEPEEEIFYIRRLYFVDDEPYSIEDVYIPKEILPAIEFTDLDVFSLYDIMEFNGIIYQHAQQTVETTRLDPKDARWCQRSILKRQSWFSTALAVIRWQSIRV